MLASDQLAEVLSSKSKTDLFIGGIVDLDGGTITLARGDLTHGERSALHFQYGRSVQT